MLNRGMNGLAKGIGVYVFARSSMQTQKPPIEYVMAWVLEAAHEASLPGAREIAQEGLNHIREQLVAASSGANIVTISNVVEEARDELAAAVKRGGLDFHAKPFLEFVDGK